MSMKIRLISGLYLLLASFAVVAGIRNYAAGLENSVWEMEQDTRLECRLGHPVPQYGHARFSSRAGSVTNMNFQLEMNNLPAIKSVAQIKSVPPVWRPGKRAVNIKPITLYRQFNGELMDRPVWVMLSELEKGMMPTFFYKDWYNPRDHVSVALSAVNFRTQYNVFMGCVSRLLPFSFEDISFTVLKYQTNSDKLTRESRRKLEMVGEYLLHDSDIDLVLVEGYTDSYGGRWLNEQLSVKRANKIKQFLLEKGLDVERIQADGHGEKRHIALNRDPLERAQNRRVVIRMNRD